MSLPKKYKIKTETLAVLKDQKPSIKISGKNFYLNYFSDSPTVQIAILVLKKHVAKSSHRNLIKRRFHFYFLKNIFNFLPGYYVFISKYNIPTKLSYESIVSEIDYFISEVSKFRQRATR